ncbi:MAG: vitamin K epoxide reductase family protein [Patescibacteria group bacterium]|jgi:uncharacterized membrane protein
MTESRWFPFLILAVSTLGFIDATYLTVQHYADIGLPCTITYGCETVTNSSFSMMFGIPVALLGVCFYVSILFLSYAALEFKQKKLLKVVSLLSIFGFVFSLWFVFVQFFIVHAICQYCMLSALTSTTIFVASMVYLYKLKTSVTSPLLSAMHEE